MRAILALFGAFAFTICCAAQVPSAISSGDPAEPASAPPSPAVVIDFNNPQLSPSHWMLTIRPDGSGHFRSEMGTSNTAGPAAIRVPNVSRDVQLSPAFATTAFQVAQRHSFFRQECESHAKVAFQGWKTLSYTGPDGAGSCKFNYSRDREIQDLGDNLMAVAETIIEGARLEMLLQHDPLGLDREIQSLSEAAKSGRAQQLCVIKAILERLAQDDHVLDLVRKRARALLAEADT